MSTWIHGLDSQCGPLAHAARSFAAQQGFASDPPRGVGALKVLARAVREHVHSGDAAGDDGPFVDGAGAFLALVLIEQLSGARYVAREGRHRVRCGPYGSFDPFGGIESVLHADDVVGALADEVARAEAEASGRGPVSRVIAEAHAQLETSSPGVRVIEHFETRLWLSRDGDSVELDLARVVDVTRGEPEEVLRGAVRHALGAVSLMDGPLAADWELARQRLVPRLFGPAFLEQLPPGQRRERVFTAPLAGQLGVALLLRYERGARYIRRDEIDAWPVDVATARRTALDNLARLSTRARFVRADHDAGPVVIARSGDGLDSARLLLPGLHDVLSPELGSPFIAAVPHRDGLIACPAGPGPLQGLVQARAREESSRAAHRISTELYMVHADGHLAVAAPWLVRD